MNIENILEKIKSIHATPVPCTMSPNVANFEFDGILEDFLTFLEEHCHKPVMVQRITFEEDMFEIKINTRGRDGEDSIDARTIARGLSRYERYLNTDFGVTILAWMKGTNTPIGFTDLDPWYNEFAEEKAIAQKTAIDEQAEALTREREAKLNKERELIEKLNSLVDDPAFRAQRTQRAMLTYATDKIEGLSELREEKVKQAIALLADKIGLRKH